MLSRIEATPDGAAPSRLKRAAERFINADPEARYTAMTEERGAEAYAGYRSAIHDPQTVHGMMEGYRAGLSIDRANDEADRSAERRIGCPVLPLWAARDDLEELYGDPLAIWRDWADDLRAGPSTAGTTSPRKPPLNWPQS